MSVGQVLKSIMPVSFMLFGLMLVPICVSSFFIDPLVIKYPLMRLVYASLFFFGIYLFNKGCLLERKRDKETCRSYLRILALASSDQIRYFNSNDQLRCFIGDFVFVFGKTTSSKMLNKALVLKQAPLVEKFLQMEKENKSLFTLDSLSSSEWGEIRSMAQEAMRNFEIRGQK